MIKYYERIKFYRIEILLINDIVEINITNLITDNIFKMSNTSYLNRLYRHKYI